MSLRPFHTFAYNGNVYLLNIEDRHWCINWLERV
jgi:hypothetical protein